MRANLLLLALFVVTSACERPTPRVICHNSNCVEPTDPDADDTLDALSASLALVDENNSPMIDGVELDIFWYGEGSRCIYAHDLSTVDDAPSPDVPVGVISDWLAARVDAGAAVTADGGPYFIFVELKPHVGESKSDKHTPEQLAAHASCGLDVVDGFAAGAVAAGVPMRIVITSFEPALLQAVADDARFTPNPAADVSVGLGALKGIPPPLDSQSLPIEAFGDVPLDMVSAHPHWLRRAELIALRQRGLEIGYWMFQAVPETFAAVERDQPEVVTTSEASLFRRWLDR
jgi:hypothetical protein